MKNKRNIELAIVSKGKLSLLEKKLLSIINRGILLSKPQNILKNQIKKLSDKSFKIRDQIVDLSNGNLYVLGWGKASAAMAEGIESILGAEMIKEGIVISTSTEYNLKKIKLFKGSHPLPSKENIYATKQIIELAKKCNENDYVICLISGGGSALLCLPVPEISLDEKIKTTKIMTLAGVVGEELNAVRKHLSRVKGGRLAKIIHPAIMFNLIISDDVHNTINSIASGATFPDTSTFADALRVIDKYGLTDKLPIKVIKYLKSCVGNDKKETLKESSAVFDKMKTFIIYDNKAFLETLRKIAIKEGFSRVNIYPQILSGDINKEILKFFSFIDNVDKKEKSILVLAGGELGVKVFPRGEGGRAQHFAALMISKLQKFKNSAFTAVATDGKDFIEGIAGALVNDKSMDEIVRKKIDYKKHIKETDTFNLHNKLGTHLFTVKPTQTNVFDVYIFAIEKPKNCKVDIL